jgi:putative transposase
MARFLPRDAPAKTRAVRVLGLQQQVRDAGLAPSIGAVGAPFDNAMVEAFWARMQVELLNRKRLKTRVELAAAIHNYIENWHNKRRRHSAMNMLTPIEFETQHQQQIAA